MKKVMFLGIFMSLSSIAFSQITDENGVSATGVFNQQLSGKIGIGTSSPTTELDVNGTVNGKKGIFSNSLANGATFADYADRNLQCKALGLSTDAATNSHLLNVYDFPQSNLNSASQLFISMNDRNNETRWRFYADTGGSSTLVYFNKNQSEFFNLTEDGSDNVHLKMPKTNSYLTIGTSSYNDNGDIYKLTVNGKVRAHAVKVYTDWADYVFEDTYQLPSLYEVEKHINDHGHLKDIPSAKEVEKNGIELGEMNKLLLQKIEELTLYTIQLKKEIDELKSTKK